MTPLRTDFETRVSEIKSYLALVQIQDSRISSTDPNIEGYKAMKAATHLLVYNLVESTATNIHDLVFDTIKNSRTPFDDLIEPLKKTVLKNAQKPSVDKLLAQLRELSFDLMDATFERDSIFSGNVDAKKLRESFRSLGLQELRPSGRVAKDGSDSLLAIKSNRNDLAHGRKTFAEIGKNMTPNDLERELRCVEVFLSQCITLVENFVQSNRFRIA